MNTSHPFNKPHRESLALTAGGLLSNMSYLTVLLSSVLGLSNSFVDNREKYPIQRPVTFSIGEKKPTQLGKWLNKVEYILTMKHCAEVEKSEVDLYISKDF